MQFVCGHLEADEWLLHKGSYVNGELDAHPFQVKHLVCKNIIDDACDTTHGKRLRSTTQLSALHIQMNDYLWCEIVSIATFIKAEEIRSEQHKQEFNEKHAM